MLYRIGDLAKETGCQPVTIRFYEKEGLLEATERSSANYRLYDDSQLHRLRLIRNCRILGMNLQEIRRLIDFQLHPSDDCGRVNSIIREHIAHVDEQIAALTHLRGHLEELLHRCSGKEGASCGILQGLHGTCGCEHCRTPSATCPRLHCEHREK